MSEYFMRTGFYWRPMGGNNIDQISGHCYQYTDIIETKAGLKASTIIVDLGKFDNHQALGVKNSVAAVPDIRELLALPFLQPKAIFLTHSHPDHLNGIIHYLKAGFRLPTLYGGRYTKLVLEELYEEFGIIDVPVFEIIKNGDKIKCGTIDVEVIDSSHTCFDSFGLIITSADDTCVYHTGDMKIDETTCFRKPTNIKRLTQLSKKINYVVADFYGITEEGMATKEKDTYKSLLKIMRKHNKERVYIPIYPTHAEMILLAFIAALKLKKNVLFFGDKNFYCYLELIKKYGIDFKKMAEKRIKVYYGNKKSFNVLENDCIVIGTFNDLGRLLDFPAEKSMGIITSGSFFNPLRGQLNAHNIKFIDAKNIPALQGCGHGQIKDYEFLNTVLNRPVFIPTHCPIHIIDNGFELFKYIGMEIARPIAQNNHIYLFAKTNIKEVHATPAVWLVVNYVNDVATFTEVWQKPTSGIGFLKRTISVKKSKNKFSMMLHQRLKRSKNENKKIFGKL